MKKDYIKFKDWLEKKGNFRAYVCYESNMVNVNHDTWWINTGTTIHFLNILQASHVEAVGTCSLILSSGFNLHLKKVLCTEDYKELNFNSGFSIFRKSEIIGCGILCDNLFHLDLQNDTTHTSMHIGLKRCIMNDDSSILGHISIERVKRLVKKGVLSTLDFIDFDTCVSCIKGKQTNKHKIGAKRNHNGVAERRNQILIDMVPSVRNDIIYILNRVPSKVVSKTPFELFKGWKSSLRHARVWGCPSEVRIYNPQEKKLDPRIISGYSLNMPKSLRTTKVPPSNSSDRLIVIHAPQVQPGVRQPNTEIPQIVNRNPIDHVENEVPVHENEQVPLRRSTRKRRSAIPKDYEVYLQESNCNVGADNDPLSFSQAVSSTDSNLWLNAMKDEMDSMASNQVWNLVELPNGVKTIGCKWVYKTQRDSFGNIERHKATLVAKEFTQRE
ncbi:hypothetical protein V2J09_003205 [Rumex salicifolius]